MMPSFRTSSAQTTPKPKRFAENSLQDMLLATDPNFSFAERSSGLYQDNTDYLLSIAQYGFVFLAKPCCLDKEVAFSTLQDMSKAALLERCIPNYVAPASLQHTAFASSSAYVKSHVAAPFAVSLDFNSFNTQSILDLHAEHNSLMAAYHKRQASLNSELEALNQAFKHKQGQFANSLNLAGDGEDALKNFELEVQDKRQRLKQRHGQEVKRLEQNLHAQINALTTNYKADLHAVAQELPVKLNELDQSHKQELKPLEAKLMSRSESLGQSVMHLEEFELRKNIKQQIEMLKQNYTRRCDELRKDYSQRQVDIRASYKQQQVALRQEYLKQVENLELQYKKSQIRLNTLYVEHKATLVAEIKQLRLSLSGGESSYTLALFKQYEQDCARVQSKLATLEAQHNKDMAAFHAVLTKNLNELKEQTLSAIKLEYDFNTDWPSFWSEEVKSFDAFLHRCLNLCLVGGALKGVFGALSDTLAVITQYHQHHLVAETQFILGSLERLVPILLSGGVHQLQGAVERIFSLLPAQSVVLHINEFDQLFVKTFADSRVCEQFMHAMQALCDALSSSSIYIKFALMTGVTRFNKTAAALGLERFVNLSKNMGFGYEDEEENVICFNIGA